MRKLASANTTEWSEKRYAGIGASEAPAACGLSDHETALDVYYRKVGRLPEKDQTDLMWFGLEIQPVIARGWQRATGREIAELEPGLFQHAEHTCVLASPDGVVTKTEGLELKSLDPHYARMLGFGRSGEGGPLPEDCVEWTIQAQQQIDVCDFDSVHFGVLIERRVVPFVVYRNDRWIKAIRKAVTDLWERIEAQAPPEPDWEHPRALQLQRELYTGQTGERIQLGDDVASLWQEYEACGESIRAAQKRRDALKARVLSVIGDNYAGVLPGHERMIRRKLIERKPYTVNPDPYFDVRAVKFDGGQIVPPATSTPEAIHDDNRNGTSENKTDEPRETISATGE